MPIAQITPLRILYTAALHGRLDQLPYLFTVIRQERAEATGPTVLVDLGRSCMADTWICDATQGRGMLVAMDAMGYDAFHIGQMDALYAQPALVQQIKQVIATPLAAGPWHATTTRQGVQICWYNASAPVPAAVTDLVIGLRLSATAQLMMEWDGARRRLLLDAGLDMAMDAQTSDPAPIIGRIDIHLLPDPPYIQLQDHVRLTIPTAIWPDPTVAGVIEFVESEARYAARKRGEA